MSKDVSKNEINLHLLFATVEHFYKGVESIRQRIVSAITDEKYELPVIESLVEDGEYDEDEKDESVLPLEIDSFHDLIRGVTEALDEYAKENPSQNLDEFRKALDAYFDAFGNGNEPEEEFNFTFGYRVDGVQYAGLKYINYNLDSDMIQVSLAGSEYDKNVGSDSYTDWIYSLGLNGWEDNGIACDLSAAMELVMLGADLDIEIPDRFIISDEDDI